MSETEKKAKLNALLELYLSDKIDESMYREKVAELEKVLPENDQIKKAVDQNTIRMVLNQTEEAVLGAHPAQAEENKEQNKILSDLSKELQACKKHIGEIENKIDSGERAFEDIRGALSSLREFEDGGVPLTKSEIEEMLLSYIEPLKKSIEQIEEKLSTPVAFLDGKSDTLIREEADETDKDRYENHEENEDEEYEDYEEDEDEDEEDEEDSAEEEFDGETAPDDMSGEYRDDEDTKEKKGLGGFAKVAISVLVILMLVVGGGYIYIKKRKAELAQQNAQAVVNPIVQPDKKAQPPVMHEQPKNMIDPNAIKTAQQTSVQQTAAPTVKVGQTAPKATAQPNTGVQSGDVRVSDTQDIPAPSYAGQGKPAAYVAPNPKERSPIEKELLGDSRKDADIPFYCRLKAKYPSGEYVYYIRDDNGKYVENPKGEGFAIEERSVVFNYSPDNPFVKLEKGKYIKTKIFANCKPINR